MKKEDKIGLQIVGVILISAFLLHLYPPPRREVRPSIRAKYVATKLVMACESFYETYQSLPGKDDTTVDAIRQTTIRPHGTQTGSPILADLIGLHSAKEANPKALNFMPDIPFAKGRKDGMIRSDGNAEIFDPWGNPYYLLLDYDKDGQLKCPFTGKIMSARRVLVWSSGPDGRSGTPETDQDNITSWNLE